MLRLCYYLLFFINNYSQKIKELHYNTDKQILLLQQQKTIKQVRISSLIDDNNNNNLQSIR